MLSLGLSLGRARGPIAAGIAPTLTDDPVLNREALVGDTMAATDGSYDGDATITVGSYQWQRSDDGSTGWADISGATSSTYVAQAADSGKYLRRGEVASNDAGSAARAYTAASERILTADWVGARAGTGSTFGTVVGTISTAQADNDGGSHALGFTSPTTGGTGGTLFQGTGVTFYNGVVRIRFRCKEVSGAAWLRMSMNNIGVSANTVWFFQPSTGNFGASPGSKVSNRTKIDEGNGWYIVYADVDITDGDVTGQFAFVLAGADGTSSITRDGSHTILIHDASVSHV